MFIFWVVAKIDMPYIIENVLSKTIIVDLIYLIGTSTTNVD